MFIYINAKLLFTIFIIIAITLVRHFTKDLYDHATVKVSLMIPAEFQTVSLITWDFYFLNMALI